MVGALVSGSKGPSSSPGRVIVLCSWARHFTLTVPISTRNINALLHCKLKSVAVRITTVCSTCQATNVSVASCSNM